MYARIPTRPILSIPVTVGRVPDAANAAAHTDYEKSLTVQEKNKKAAAIEHLIDIGDPNDSMKSYNKTVPGIVAAVLAQRFEGTPYPWAVGASTSAMVPKVDEPTDFWSSPVLGFPAEATGDARISIDPADVDELLDGVL